MGKILLYRLFLSSFVFLFGLQVVSQPLSWRKDWFFGKGASIEFSNQNQPIFGAKNPHSVYKRIASAYQKSGVFAFKTGGNGIYDINNTLIVNLGLGNPTDVKVMNHSENDSLFNILTLTNGNLYHTIFNFFTRKVISQPKMFQSSVGRSFLVVKHCYAQGFWVIAPLLSKKWQAYYLQGSSLQKGIESSMTLTDPSVILDITSSFKGDKIAVSNYAEDGFVALSDFDSKCGVVSNSIKLPQSTTQIEWDYPLGIEFSPSDMFLYVCYSNGLSQLVQYRVSDVSQYQVISSTTEDAVQFDDILMAPDGKAYLNRHNSGNPSRQIDVIELPNAQGFGCGYRQNVHQLLEFKNGGFQFPPFINCYVSNYCGRSVREFGDNTLGIPCVGNTLEFFTRYPANTFESVEWVIEYAGNTTRDTGLMLEIELNTPGKLVVTKIKKFCFFQDTLKYEYIVNAVPSYVLTPDSTICFGANIDIEVITNAEKITWSTGDTLPKIQVKEGIYKVQLANGACLVDDSVSISSYPPLSILLGDDFYICERENELVKLDAGKGFVNYLWHPTQDTTQWIIVNKVGSYYVIVEDFRGCTADKGTRVAQRCDLVYFVPNAVGPGHGSQENFRVIGDGIVSVEMQIYNRWGELIFSGDGLKGWNPNSYPEGVYMYTIKVSGYKSKIKRFEFKSGNVTLLK